MSAEQYYQLGVQEYQKSNLQRAVDAFNRSLAIKKSWQSYRGLGTALNGQKQYQKAIDAFHKSLAIQKNWQSYQGLGIALNKLCESKKAALAAKEFFALKPNLGHINIDPLAGEKEGVIAGQDLIKELANFLLRKNFSFYPSFFCQEPESIELASWKHLVYIHIHKCAGTNFERPLSRMAQHLKDYKCKQKPLESNKRNFLWQGNLKEKYLLDGYLMEINSQNHLNRLQGIILC